MGNMGNTLTVVGRGEEAMPLHERALHLQTRAHGESHLEIAATLGNLGATYVALGRLDEGRESLDKALAMLEQLKYGSHPIAGDALHGRGLLALRAGRPAEAETYLVRALAIRESGRPKNYEIAATLALLARVDIALGRAQQGVARAKRALQLTEGALGPSHPEVADDLTSLGLAYLATHAPAEAAKVLTRAAAIRAAVHVDDRRTEETRDALAVARSSLPPT
jgi:tetratricopeptide (TPR) repeat protein